MKKFSRLTCFAVALLMAVSALALLSGCNSEDDRDSRRTSDEPTSTTREAEEETSTNEHEIEAPNDPVTSASETEDTELMSQETTREDVDGPGGMTPFGPEQDVLFDMYTIPADWPRVVPIMSEFKVTIYERTDDGMYTAGYGNVSMSRANNYYTNAQKIHVSSNIWEQDPEVASVTEGVNQTFVYIADGHSMTVNLIESGDTSLYFEIYYTS
ncbi:MAG: hypothetical protein GX099_04870 [Clostridiaceae bacterium]|nr:hypothetical protein [Clostridiaceae bacterium]